MNDVTQRQYDTETINPMPDTASERIMGWQHMQLNTLDQGMIYVGGRMEQNVGTLCHAAMHEDKAWKDSAETSGWLGFQYCGEMDGPEANYSPWTRF